MGYFKFLLGSRIICLPFNIPENLYWQHLFQKPEEAETHSLYLSQYNTIATHAEEQHPPFSQKGTTTIFWFRCQSCTWPRSDLFCWQNPCSGCNSRIDLVVVLEYAFFQLYFSAKQISVRLTRLRRSYGHRSAVVLSNHTSYTELLLYLRCAVQSGHIPFFCSCLSLMIVHLRNLFLLSTPFARILLTPRCVVDKKMWNSYPWIYQN